MRPTKHNITLNNNRLQEALAREQKLKEELDKKNKPLYGYVEKARKVEAAVLNLQVENKRLKKQLKEGHHCSSFGMCGQAGEAYEKRIIELEKENKRLKEAVRDIHTGYHPGPPCECAD